MKSFRFISRNYEIDANTRTAFPFLPPPSFLSFFLPFDERKLVDRRNEQQEMCPRLFFDFSWRDPIEYGVSGVSVYVQKELAGGELEKDGRSKDNGLQPSPPPSSREGDFRIHVTSPIIAITANQSWGISRFNVSREKSTAIYSYVVIVDVPEEKEKTRIFPCLFADRQPIFRSVPPPIFIDPPRSLRFSGNLEEKKEEDG